MLGYVSLSEAPISTLGGVAALEATPSVGSLLLSGYAPTVASSLVASPGLGSLLITGFIPSIATSWIASPGLGSLLITGFAPTLWVGSLSYTAEPSTGGLEITGYAPSARVPVPEPGYGPNGEKIYRPGPIDWLANPPPIPVIAGGENYITDPVGSEILPNIPQYEDEGWTSLDFLGYVSTGERRSPAGAATWTTQEPPVPVLAAHDYHLVVPIGTLPLPIIDQDDDEVWSFIYLSGVP